MSSEGAALTEQVLALRCGCAAPLGLNKYVTMINPGLAPWAMKEYRPYRALRRLPPIDILYSFDAVCPGQSSQKTSTRTYFHEYSVLTIKNCQGKHITTLLKEYA